MKTSWISWGDSVGYAKSRWQDIYNVLKKKGIDVYSPGQHKGECTSKYVVVKVGNLAKVQNVSTVQRLYDLLLYVPKDEYSSLELFEEEVKTAMKELEPMIRPMFSQTGSFFDDTVDGHMTSLQYLNYRKIV